MSRVPAGADAGAAPHTRLIVTGDAEDVVDAIAAVLPPSVRRVAVDSTIDNCGGVQIAFVALSRIAHYRSDIARAQEQLRRFRARLSDDAVIVVISAPGPLERFGFVMERLIGPEVRHQVVVASGGARDRSLAGRLGARMLEAIGVDVYQLRAMT